MQNSHPASNPARNTADSARTAPPQPPALAAVLVSYRTGPVLVECLRALQAQPGLDELVLVNNGNPPRVERWLQELAQADPRVRLLSGHGNIGFAAGNNLGARATQAERLLFINPDVILPADCLPLLVAEHQALPREALLSPLLVNPDYTEQRGSRRTVLTPWRAVVEWLGLYHLAPQHPYFRRFNRTSEPLPLHTHPVDVTSGAAMLMRRDLYFELGGFDEGYFLHVEDVDLCVSLLKRGGSSYVASQVRVVHHQSSSRASRLRVEWHKARGFCRYFRKHFPGVYPRGFISLVNTLVWLRFGLRLPLQITQSALRRWRQSGRPAAADMDGASGAGGPH